MKKSIRKPVASGKHESVLSQWSRVQKAFDAFLLTKKSEGISRETQKRYSYELNRFGLWLAAKGIIQFPDVTAAHFRAYIAEGLERGLKPRTVHITYRVLRTLSYWYEVENEGEYISPFHKMRAPKLPDDERSVVDVGTLEVLLQACKHKDNRHRERDTAILLLTFDSGLRASELCNLKADDLNPITGELRILDGKGGKDRRAFIGRETLKAVRKYLRTRGDVEPHEPLFSTDEGYVFGYSSLLSLLKRTEQRAGIKIHGWHALRRGFATSFLASGGDLITLSRLLGHSQVSTTAIYTRLSPEQLQTEHSQHSPVDGMHRRGSGK